MTERPNSPSDAVQDELDPNSLAAIRNLLAGDDPAEAAQGHAATDKRAAPSSLAQQAQVDDGSPQKMKKKKAPKAPRAPGESMMDRIKASVLGYRPTAKHIVLAGLALLVLFRPWLMLGLVFVLLFLVIGVFLILGYDGFWQQVMRVARWYARKHPSRSLELHRRLDTFAVQFDAFLDRFPEGTVDGLYLPDFGDLAAAEARHTEAVDRRLDNLRENEA